MEGGPALLASAPLPLPSKNSASLRLYLREPFLPYSPYSTKSVSGIFWKTRSATEDS
jgi:hypothetical protein